MGTYAQGIFTPKHPDKYLGRGSVRYRSSWEWAVMNFCDNHPSITQWASENIRIPYRNPITGKATNYVPDFFVVFVDKDDKTHGEVWEIKPKKEVSINEAKSQRDKIMAIVNGEKWRAASAWCKQNGLTFRVITEEHLFFNGRKR